MKQKHKYLLSQLSGLTTNEEKLTLKGIVHPKMKIQSISTHPHADGWVTLFSPQNTAGVSQKKGVAVMSQTIVVNGD